MRSIFRNPFFVVSLAVFAAVFVSNARVSAENTDDGTARAAQMAEQLKQQLSLSDDQATQIRTILANGMANRTAPTGFGSDEEFQKFREQKKQEWQQIQDQINSVLTEEQQQKYQQVRNSRLQRGPGQGRGRGGNGGGMPQQGNQFGGQRGMPNGPGGGYGTGMPQQGNQFGGQNGMPNGPGGGYGPQGGAGFQGPQQGRQENTMFNPTTGRTYPANYKYDPLTGEPLKEVQQ
ncbi:MAG TPA: hypothetical protein PKL97_02185 [Candidatus Omnitrophota bacterium]|nr:hypothetical protein [Candidatus Omnitrophota bacterium]